MFRYCSLYDDTLAINLPAIFRWIHIGWRLFKCCLPCWNLEVTSEYILKEWVTSRWRRAKLQWRRPAACSLCTPHLDSAICHWCRWLRWLATHSTDELGGLKFNRFQNCLLVTNWWDGAGMSCCCFESWGPANTMEGSYRVCSRDAMYCKLCLLSLHPVSA